MPQERFWLVGVLSVSLLLLGPTTAAMPCAVHAQEALKPTDAQVAALIDELKHLPTTFDRNQFLGRRAMSELFIYGPYSFPKLKIAALGSENWSVAISAAYLCSLLTSIPDYDVQRSLLAMTQHEHVHVRVAASSLLIYGDTGIKAKEVLRN